jgi:hypothetical protein
VSALVGIVLIVLAALLAVTWFDRRWKGREAEVAEQEIS